MYLYFREAILYVLVSLTYLEVLTTESRFLRLVKRTSLYSLPYVCDKMANLIPAESAIVLSSFVCVFKRRILNREIIF